LWSTIVTGQEGTVIEKLKLKAGLARSKTALEKSGCSSRMRVCSGHFLATEENPFDLDAWNILLRELQTRKIEDVRPLFEKLVKIFPTTGRFWKIYIEQEMKARNFDKVEKVSFTYNSSSVAIIL
jgi:hypothetical protein